MFLSKVGVPITMLWGNRGAESETHSYIARLTIGTEDLTAEQLLRSWHGVTRNFSAYRLRQLELSTPINLGLFLLVVPLRHDGRNWFSIVFFLDFRSSAIF